MLFRSEKLINVPVAVTALSAAAIERAHVTDLTQVAQMTPNLIIAPAGSGTGGSQGTPLPPPTLTFVPDAPSSIVGQVVSIGSLIYAPLALMAPFAIMLLILLVKPTGLYGSTMVKK